jgi:hypothetical protein
VLEAPLLSEPALGEDVATNLDVERMAASFAITTPARKKPRH